MIQAVGMTRELEIEGDVTEAGSRRMPRCVEGQKQRADIIREGSMCFAAVRERTFLRRAS